MKTNVISLLKNAKKKKKKELIYIDQEYLWTRHAILEKSENKTGKILSILILVPSPLTEYHPLPPPKKKKKKKKKNKKQKTTTKTKNKKKNNKTKHNKTKNKTKNNN